jgi:hypothetical protein
MKNMTNIYTDTIKGNMKRLGLIGSKLIDTQSVDHLFLNDWVVANKREPKLYPNGLPWTGDYTKKVFMLDQENSYLINSLGFRGKEFNKNNELLFSGCSFTFGLGLPEKEIWGTRIADNLGMEYSNLGLPGDSVVGIITNIYKYFEEYGHPKILLCLFPDFYRFLIPVNSDVLITKHTNTDRSMLSGLHILHQETEEYSKKPHYAENVFSTDLTFFYSYQYIRMLEKYCKQAGILFLWSTWSESLYDLIIQQNNISENFVYLKSNRWIRNGSFDIYLDNCTSHDHLKDVYPNNFDRSTDVEDGDFYNKRSFHSGVHKHIHWAEGFMEAINDNPWN